MIDFGILRLLDLPSPRKIKFTGSREYFVPQHMSVELTSNCNLKCVYCYREANSSIYDYLEKEILINSLEKLAKSGLRSVELTGGEPLLHPNFFEVLEYCINRFDQVVVLTNGCLITDRIASFCETHRGKLFFQIDLDGSTSAIHDFIRGVPGGFNQTIAGIKRLVAHKVRLRIAMNIVKSNVYDIENTLLLAKALGVTWFTFVPIVNIGRAKNLPKLSVEELQYFLEMTNLARERYGDFIATNSHDEIIQRHKAEKNCGMGYKAAVLGPTGNIRPCLMLSERIITLGNLPKQTVSEIFSNPIVKFLHDLESPSEATCSGCRHELYCRYCISRGLESQSIDGSSCSWGEKNNVTDLHIPVSSL